MITTDETYSIINPLALTADDLPVIALEDNRNSFLGWLIKSHTKGDYNHAFIIHRPGYCVSQDFNGFKERPISDFMKDDILLKLWGYRGVTNTQRQSILTNINTELIKARSWLSYDYLGLIGQWFGFKGLNNPWQKYCSERVEEIIKPLSLGLPLHPSPTDLNIFFNNHQPPMFVKGYWLSE